MSREAPPHTDHGDSAIGTRPHTLMFLSVAEQEYAVGQVATMRRQGLPAPEAKLRSIMGAIPKRALFSGRATLIGVSRAASIGTRMESRSSSLHDWLALSRKRETTRKLDEIHYPVQTIPAIAAISRWPRPDSAVDEFTDRAQGGRARYEPMTRLGA